MINSIHLYIIVEGLSEQTFVSNLITPHLATRNIHVKTPIIGKPGKKGGNITFERAKKDILNFLKQQNNTIITTFFDFYGMDINWPGRRHVNKIQNYLDKVQYLERCTLDAICDCSTISRTNERVIPHFTMHEFEALLYSNPIKLASFLNVQTKMVERICDEFNNPEEINDNAMNAPSKRIEQFKPNYRKVVDGNAIAKSIGLDHIRKKCIHFNKWLLKLESLI